VIIDSYQTYYVNAMQNAYVNAMKNSYSSSQEEWIWRSKFHTNECPHCKEERLKKEQEESSRREQKEAEYKERCKKWVAKFRRSA
jgi:hypothetical protein